MPVTLRKLSDLNSDNVVQQVNETLARIREDNPNIDLKKGPFFGVLAYYHALLAEQRAAEVADYNTGRSLLLMSQDPAAAQTDLVDDTLSNFRVARQLGTFAAGQVTLLFSSDLTVTIGIGSSFQAEGKLFHAIQTFTGKAEAGQINQDSDRLLTKTDDGNYAMVIDVLADAVGTEYEIKKDSTVVPVVPPNNFVTGFATNDFLGGRSTETNDEVLQRFQSGVPAKAPSIRANMEAMLRDVDDFSGLLRMSIIGFGDVEMLRDQHAIWPGSLGGRVDWYVRTTENLYRQLLTVTAVLVEVDLDGYGIWQFSLDKDTASGFYEIANIRPLDSINATSPFDIVSDERSFDVSGGGTKYLPDVINVTETAYTRYQTATIRFRDGSRSNTYNLGDSRQVQCEARGMPFLADIQDYINSRDIRSYGADLLIKAPMPCFLKVHLAFSKQAGVLDPDLAAIKDGLCRVVNNAPFRGRLFASQLFDTAQNYLSSGIYASAIDMFGRLRYPDGSLHYIRSNEALVVPEDYDQMVSPRTVQFFLSPEDISVSIETTLPSLNL